MEEPEILQYLKTLPHAAELCFFPNPGNAGDAMIALAACQLFARAGLGYRRDGWSQPPDPSGGIMVYGGGGNLIELYETARQTILRHYPRVERLVILPHSVRGNEDLLAGFGPNVDVLCREPLSYAHVRRHAPRAKVYLMDDLALQLDGRALLAGGPRTGEPVPAAWRRRDALFAALLPFRLALGRGAAAGGRAGLNAFRKDLESTGRFPGRAGVDVALLFAHPIVSEAAARYVTIRLLQVIDRFETVRTDRLHVCIAAALLGKRVEFFANSYFKCQAVYEYSLRERFPNVHWMG